jgi:hypothetical protein
MNHDFVVTISKFGTVLGGLTTIIADRMSNLPIAVYGLWATILFGTLGLLVTYYFKNKEYKIKLADFKLAHNGLDPEEFLATQIAER